MTSIWPTPAHKQCMRNTPLRQRYKAGKIDYTSCIKCCRLKMIEESTAYRDTVLV